MKFQKAAPNIILIILVVVLTSLCGYFIFVKKSATILTEQPSLSADISNTKLPDSVVNPNWKKYSGSSFEFEYPSLIILNEEGKVIRLSHSVSYKHNNPCDFKGDAVPLEKLADFGVSISVSNKNLKDTIQSNEGSDYITKDFFKNNTLTLSPGFIDEFSVGSLKGFQITTGAEGCGRFSYYFSISSSKTLFVNRSYVPELNSVNTDYKTYLNLTDIILPSQEYDFFVKILSSLKVKS